MKAFPRIKELFDDPLGFICDWITKAIIHLALPVSLPDEIIRQFRAPILGCLASVLIIGILIFVSTGLIIFSPFLVGSKFLETITSLLPSTQTQTTIFDSTFSQSSTPSKIPLGGNKLDYGVITAGFMDNSYYLAFGKNHTGIDLVPNDTYFKESTSYSKYKKVIVYATHTGTANFYIDSEGGETVEITNADQSLKTIYIHFKDVYIKSGDTIQAGQALGEMGKTGFATGEHIHYEIRTKDGGSWVAVNPLLYIH